MNTANAIGFFLLGTVMQVLPVIGGQAGYDAASTQTLWLQFMGVVTGGLGAGYLVRMGAAEAATLVSRLAVRRADLRARAPQPARHAMPLGGVRVTF